MRKSLSIIAIFIVLTLCGWLSYGCGRKKSAKEISDVRSALVQAEKTIEISRGLFVKKTAETDDIARALKDLSSENSKLKSLVDSGRLKIVSLNETIVSLKKQVGSLPATQVDVPSIEIPSVTRTAVNFSGKLGPFRVDGQTITSPAESRISIVQERPLKLSVAIVRSGDGLSTVVETDDEVDIDVKSSHFDLRSIVDKRSWYQNIWLSLDAVFLGDFSTGITASYNADRWSLGVSCRDHGCGIQVGRRLF